MKKVLFVLILFIFPFVAWADVVINEVAWMGGYSYEGESALSAAKNEWIELFNSGVDDIDLTGWALNAQDGLPAINLEGTIFANSYFLLERTDDESVPGVAADFIYGTNGSSWSLSNDGEVLILKNSSDLKIDQIDGSDGWRIDGSAEPIGDNGDKRTAQRTSSGWITAISTPRAQNAAYSLEEQTEEESESAGADQWVVDNKNISADAGEDKVAIVGATIEFEAAAYGIQGEPLQSADFLWNFGDGSFKRGRGVFHTYNYPGVYLVSLDVSSANYNDSDSLKVEVIPNGIIILEIKPGKDGWVEIYNDSQYDLDISRWRLSNGKMVFYIPKDTKILAGAYLVIPYEITNIEFFSNGMAKLLYPNDREASMLSYSGILQNDESFHNIDGISKIGLQSPGEERFVQRAENSAADSNYGPRRSVIGSDGLASVKGVEAPEETQSSDLAEEKPELQNVAAVQQSKEYSIVTKTWFWLVLVLSISFLSAIGFLAIKKLD